MKTKQVLQRHRDATQDVRLHLSDGDEQIYILQHRRELVPPEHRRFRDVEARIRTLVQIDKAETHLLRNQL